MSMPPDPNNPPGPPPPQPLPGGPIPAPGAPAKKKGGCLGCFLGCLGVIVVGILVIGGCSYVGYKELMKKSASAVAEFKSQGFDEQKDSMITVDSSIQGKKLLNADYMAVVTSGSDSDLAIVTFVGIVEAKIQGNLFFRGGVLVIAPGAVILGDVDVDCYNVIVQGYVQGQVKGNYKQLDETQRQKTPPPGLEELPVGESPPPVEAPAPEAPPPELTPPPVTAPTPPAEPPPPTTSPPAEVPPPPAAPEEPQPNAPEPQPPTTSETPAPPPQPTDTPPPTEPPAQ